MAETLFVQIALDNLTSLIKEEVGLIIGADKEMKKLASIFTTVQAVLEDAQLKQLKSKPIQNWLSDLTDATYEIDDILDECTTHVSKSKYLPRRFSLEKILFRHKIGRRIKQAIENLDVIVAKREKFHLRETNFERPSHVDTARETGSLLNEMDQIFGREDDKEKIVDILVNQVKGNPEISILPIIGLGGLGKTTLAQLVLKDPRVVEHFGTKSWVCVSDNFDVKTLIKAIIESASGKGSASDLTSLDALQQQLWGLLNRQRYLLVLDDVWNEDQQKWSQLRNALSCGSAGSSIIVTTRLRKVAEIVGTLPSYDLDELSEEHCWMLLKHHAFRCDEEERFPNLVVVGKEIVKKCAGVPLAAKTLGGILRFKDRTEKEWIGVKESELWDLTREETSILPVLKLSYHHLPLELRQCFTYCAIFPKDFTISKGKLVLLWMAHEYISSNGKLEVEDVGEQRLNELIARSLLQICEHDDKKLRMHDLVHDLAQSIMEDKVPRTQLGMSTSASNSKIREVNLSKHYMAFPRAHTEMDITSILKDCPRLRVLRASGEKLNKLPSTIGSLKHLRSLNLSHSNIRILPNSICSLWNLKVLNLNYCSKLKRFPKKMRYLRNLRHLLIEGCGQLCMTPSTISELTFLRTLSMFMVNYNKGHRLEELEKLNLGGKLEIWLVDRVISPTDAKKANLVEKHNLRDLRLYWDIDNVSEDRDKMVLDALQPHSNLECLSLYGFSGKHLANWMKRSAVPKLVKITMGCCQNLSDLSPVEEFTHLEHLDLNKVSIEYFGPGGNAVNSHFPALKELDLCDLCNLKRFFKEEVGQDVCPKLQKLSVQKCPCLVLPPLNNLEELACDNSSTLDSISKLENLKTLNVIIGEDMKFIPSESLKHLTNLETLKIYGANEQCVPIDGLRGLNSLQKLEIWGSKTLTCLPKAWLHHNSTLQEIQIAACPEFVDMPEEIKHLHALKKIHLLDLEKMVCIPDAIKQVCSLELLNLAMLPSLTSLPDWLGGLTSLRDLSIFQCEKVASLPDAIQRLTNLKSLGVAGCPDLKRRCEEGKGEDWHKIAHIPFRFFPEGMDKVT